MITEKINQQSCKKQEKESRSMSLFIRLVFLGMVLMGCGTVRSEARPTAAPSLVPPWNVPVVSVRTETRQEDSREQHLHAFAYNFHFYRQWEARGVFRGALYHHRSMTRVYIDEGRSRVARIQGICPQRDRYNAFVSDHVSLRGSDGVRHEDWCITYNDQERLQEADQELEDTLLATGMAYCRDDVYWYAFYNLPSRQEEEVLHVRCFAADGSPVASIIPRGLIYTSLDDLRRRSPYRPELSVGTVADFSEFPLHLEIMP